MTLKNAFFRYLKERGLFGVFISVMRLGRINPSRKKFEDLFYNFDGLCRYHYGFNVFSDKYYYVGNFIKDWMENKGIVEIKKGDKISVKTLEGKYTYEYIVIDVFAAENKITIAEPNGMRFSDIPLERIDSVNGKKVDFINGWRLKKVNSIKKFR